MRILIASPYLPWPLSHGGSAAQFATLKCLSEDHEFTLVCPVFKTSDVAAGQELSQALPHLKVRAVLCSAEEGQALLERALRWFLRSTRNHLRRVRPNATGQSRVKALPYYPFNLLPRPYLEVVQEEIAAGPDLIQVEFAEMMSLGAWLPPHVPNVFVHHQLHFVYTERFLQLRRRAAFPVYLDAVMKAQEVAFLRFFHGVITFSEVDRKLLAPYVPVERIFVSPFPVPSDLGITSGPANVFGGEFVFLGAEDHYPNRDALDWLLAEIWPKVRKQLPGARLKIIGSWGEATQRSLRRPDLFFTGFVPQLAPAIKGGILLVPLRIGSGIRTKILAALAEGVPVVATPTALEGLTLPEDATIAESDPEGFAAKAVQLATNHKTYSRLSQNGPGAVEQHYSPEIVRRRRNEIYGCLRAQQSQFRKYA